MDNRELLLIGGAGAGYDPAVPRFLVWPTTSAAPKIPVARLLLTAELMRRSGGVVLVLADCGSRLCRFLAWRSWIVKLRTGTRDCATPFAA